MGFVFLSKEGGWNFVCVKRAVVWFSIWPKFYSVKVQSCVQKVGLG